MGSGMGLGMLILSRNGGAMTEFLNFGRPLGDGMGFLEQVCRYLCA